jgi:hypothetical protein
MPSLKREDQGGVSNPWLTIPLADYEGSRTSAWPAILLEYSF